MKTSELRWFLPEQDAPNLQEWFLQGAGIKPEERPDRYLLLPDCKTVGVKLRGGEGSAAFEIKAMVGDPKEITIKPSVEGSVEVWTKWSVKAKEPNLASGIERLMLSDPNARWRTVAKQRFMRKFSLANGFEEVFERVTGAGCNAELTRLTLEPGRGAWISLAFEAFSDSGNTDEVLKKSVEEFFRMQPDPGVALTHKSSGGYPFWLTLLLAQP